MTIGARFSSADLETLPDIPGVRYEIIDGELHVSRQPSLGHQDATDAVCSALRVWSRQRGTGRAYSEPGLVFGDDDDVVPDVVWISRARLAEAEDEKGHLRLAPELVVEVLSPGPANEFRDQVLKLELYSRRGVQEYWIVDRQRRAVQVFRRSGDALSLAATLGGQDSLTSPLLPSFALPVSELWEPFPPT